MLCKISRIAGAALILALAGSACTLKSKKEPPNTIRVPVEAKIKGLDPIYSDDIYSSAEIARSYEGLLQYSYLKRPFELEPNLAEAMPAISPDGKTITFKIKKGVLFQDDAAFKATGGKGRELTADDFIYSWKRIADPKLVSTAWWIFDGKIAGINEWREEATKSGAADYNKPIEGLKAVDRYTLQITLKQRSTQFLYFLAMVPTYAVPKEAVEAYGKEMITHAVGTGPFKLEEFNPSSKVVWTKNPTYRKELYPSEGAPGDKEAGLLEDAGKPLPRADRIVVTVYEERQPMWLNFMAGNIDYSAIPKDNFSSAVTASKELTPEMQAKGIKLQKTVLMDLTRTAFNMDDPIVGKNKLLRQALTLAMDPETLIETFYNGRAISAQGPIPPNLAGYDPNFRNPYKQHNLQRAKEMLAKAGYPDGKGLPPLEYVSLADSTGRQMAEFAQQLWGKIGVKVKIDGYSWPEFQAKVKGRKAQIFGMGWQGDYPDAENFLQLFYGKNVSPGPNDMNYKNAEFDALYEKALLLPDNAERSELYKKMVAILAEDAPCIFEVHRLGYSVSNGWFRNYKPNEMDSGRAKYWAVDDALKAKAQK